ncbi:PREDICTED: uncharacterized protein LOC103323430 [Prunus mume]|uniref:Uncharacterized protein LOC103323430 n=1 Tax=Prunus mume TaxID=102107 RepID=A0ABM0NEM3_PRUMU|nr:PREDICTED: uncharacterized protein LOC103323430 [Prunus mume]
MALEDDDWDLSAEELDSLERDAFQKLAQQCINSASACSSSSSSSHNHHQLHPSLLPRIASKAPLQNPFPILFLTSNFCISLGSFLQLVAFLQEDERLKELPKLSVKFFLHASGNIATTFPYNQVLVGAVRKVPKSSWNAKERLWMFPISSLSSAEKFLHETSGVNVEVENVDPLVHLAIAAASVFPDILGSSIPSAATGTESYHPIRVCQPSSAHSHHLQWPVLHSASSS